MKKSIIGLCVLGALVLSITEANAEEFKRGKLLSAWDFTKATEKNVPNEVAGLKVIHIPKKHNPIKVAEGLQFTDGQRAHTILKEDSIPGFTDGKGPFEITARFKVNKGCEGYCAAIFTNNESLMLVMMKSMSFRMNTIIDKKAKNKIYLPSIKENKKSMVFEFGKFYDVSIKFMPDKTELRINGKLNNSIDKGALIPRYGIFRLGSGWGQNRFFNGVISYIKIYKLDKK